MPDTISVRTPAGEVHENVPMWTYWNLQEGEITVDPLMFATADGGAPPVIHLDTEAPLYTTTASSSPTSSGDLLQARPPRCPGWCITVDRRRRRRARPVPLDHRRRHDLPDMWCAALSHAMSRFEGCRGLYKQARSGGVGAFTADNFPVFDHLKPNVYTVFDSNHGYKMIGVGREVAKVLLGDHSSLLYPFRYERFETGDLHPVSIPLSRGHRR